MRILPSVKKEVKLGKLDSCHGTSSNILSLASIVLREVNSANCGGNILILKKSTMVKHKYF